MTKDLLRLGGVNITPGSSQFIRLPVTQDLDGGEVAIAVHVISGIKPGPTLGLFGVQHGDEWMDIELMRQLVAGLDPQKISGRVVVVPVCNPIALGNVQRNTQPESDAPDLNRVWPGTHTWLTDSIAKVLSREVVQHCDAVLDFHYGPWGAAFAGVAYGIDFPNSEVVQASQNIAVAFGSMCIGKLRVVSVFPGPRSLMGYASAVLGIPSLGIEMGGAGFGVDLERGWIADNVRGMRNVMRHLGILDEPLEKPERILTYTRTTRINPSKGGLLVPEQDPGKLLRQVTEGELLGRIVSPYTFETLEELRSPCDGFLFYFSRLYPVRPGDWGFGVLNAKDTEWIEP